MELYFSEHFVRTDVESTQRTEGFFRGFSIVMNANEHGRFRRKFLSWYNVTSNPLKR